MKRNRLYLTILVVLTALSLYLFLSRRSGTYPPPMHEFAVRDTGMVESVMISAARQQVNLSRKSGTWKVNGMPARKESILSLQVLISRLEVDAPVSTSIKDRIRTQLAEEGRKVMIGMADGSSKSYSLYYDSLSDFTFMMIEGSGIPFRVRVRGYRQTNLAELFVTGSRYWRDNLIFQHSPEDISSVFLQNNANTGMSFHLARNKEGAFEVASGIVPGSWTPARVDKVSQYLGYFYNVRFESFMDSSRDTLQHSENPDFVLTLELISGERSTLNLFVIYHITEHGEMQADYDRLYAQFGRAKEWVVLKYIEIDPIMKEYNYFAGP